MLDKLIAFMTSFQLFPNYIERWVIPMTCADYVISMNFNSLESRFHTAHRRGPFLSDSSYTLVKRAIDTYKKERAKALAPYVNSSVSKVCLLDALRILDRRRVSVLLRISAIWPSLEAVPTSSMLLLNMTSR